MKEHILEILKRLKDIVSRTRDITGHSRTLGQECDEIEGIIDSLEQTVARQIDQAMSVKLNRRKRK